MKSFEQSKNPLLRGYWYISLILITVVFWFACDHSSTRRGRGNQFFHLILSKVSTVSQAADPQLFRETDPSLESTDLIQLYRFWTNPDEQKPISSDKIFNIHSLLQKKLNKNNRTSIKNRTDFKSMDFSISQGILRNVDCQTLVLNVSEKINGSRSHGGSSYELQIINKKFGLHAICSMADMFNGDYAFQCPCLSKELTRTANATLNIVYANYDAYRQTWEPWNHQIWTHILGGLKEYHGEAAYSSNCPGYWLNINNTQTWIQSGSPILYLEKSQSRSCLENYESISIFGDSHMRYLFYYFLIIKDQLNTTLPRILRQPKTIENLNFDWTASSGRLHDRLLSYEKEIKSDSHSHSKKLLIINCLHWEIRDGKLNNYVSGMIKVFTALKRLSKVPNLKIIWLTAPAHPDSHVEDPFTRNNFILHAINRWTQLHMNAIGIPVIDRFKLTYARQAENVCVSHYICINPREANEKMKGIKGEVGQGFMETLLSTICSDSSSLD